MRGPDLRPERTRAGRARPPGMKASPGERRPRRILGQDLYELLAPAYRMLASPARIRDEIDAIAPHLHGLGVRRVLDAGCGSGFHAVELAHRGWKVTGIDSSPAMIREARNHAAREGIKARFLRRDLCESADLPGGAYDAVLCLGNTLSSNDREKERSAILRAFRRALRPGGMLVIQVRDLSRIPRGGYAFPVRSFRRGEKEWILLRQQIPKEEGVLFLSTLLYRTGPGSAWETRSSSNIQMTVGERVWKKSLVDAGFGRVRAAGDLRGSPRRVKSPDLVLFARRGP